MKKNTSKTTSYIWYGVIAVISIIFLIYIFNLQNSDTTSSTQGVSSGTTYSGTHYTDTSFHFSFAYPDGLKLNSFANPQGGEVVLIRASSTSEEGIQITAQPFNEPQTTSITVDRIHHDVPDMEVVRSSDVTVGGIGKGVSFYDGTDASAKEQIWFVAKDILYQVTATPAYVDAAKQIISSWQFE